MSKLFFAGSYLSLNNNFRPQCEKEFHVGCLKDHGIQDLKVLLVYAISILDHIVEYQTILVLVLKLLVYQELPDGMWFCCKNCQEINQSLQKSVVHGEQELLESLLNLIKKKDNEENFEMGIELDIKWRIVNRKIASNNETESLLSQAVAIFHVSFYWLLSSDMFFFYNDQKMEGP